MNKYMVGYCCKCREKTKHKVIECEESIRFRVFETIITMGWAIAMPHDYHCECTKCGKINTLTK